MWFYPKLQTPLKLLSVFHIVHPCSSLVFTGKLISDSDADGLPWPSKAIKPQNVLLSFFGAPFQLPLASHQSFPLATVSSIRHTKRPSVHGEWIQYWLDWCVSSTWFRLSRVLICTWLRPRWIRIYFGTPTNKPSTDRDTETDRRTATELMTRYQWAVPTRTNYRGTYTWTTHEMK